VTSAAIPSAAAATRSTRTTAATPMRAASHGIAEDGRVIETLELVPALTRPDLLAAPVLAALRGWEGERPVERIAVAEIDPEVADTAAFSERYRVPLAESANCVVISGRRAGEARQLACVVLATTRADVNGIARRRLDVRKASFLPMDEAVAGTAMEYGGITPIGLPLGWPVLVDAAVAAAESVVIGSGLRRSKLRLPGEVLAGLPGVEVVDGLGR
jgi:prolyl-tRNA editing enzyme YbaK/EbsC (Cys-tRNA(Pro) deacylase)